MPKEIFVIKNVFSGYGAFTDEEMSVVGRFTTKRKATNYLKKIAKHGNTEVENDIVSTDDEMYQIIQIDLATLPVDPTPDLPSDEED